MPSLRLRLFCASFRRVCRSPARTRSLLNVLGRGGNSTRGTKRLPVSIDFPQVRHRLCGRTATLIAGVCVVPFASRLRCWVKGVASPLCRESFRRDQSARAVHSANGATARAHIGAVSLKWMASDAISRQVPSRCSKSHSRFSGSRVIQSNT
jgi:hypothetical protein